ncbi:hypothetical protein BDV32DRAFT_133993 [Aspergillus pseudonomiae]|nr:hypothetical protein BDV32DRAFT_133993 [Aspergillus pseudonomiae]
MFLLSSWTHATQIHFLAPQLGHLIMLQSSLHKSEIFFPKGKRISAYKEIRIFQPCAAAKNNKEETWKDL